MTSRHDRWHAERLAPILCKMTLTVFFVLDVCLDGLPVAQPLGLSARLMSPQCEEEQLWQP